MQKPSFWRLFGAYTIDFIITFFIVWFVWKCLLKTNFFLNTDLLGVLKRFALCAFIPALLYFAVCERVWKKTLGKKIFGVKTLAENQRLFEFIVAYGIDFLFFIPVQVICIIVTVLYMGFSCWNCGLGAFEIGVLGGMGFLFLSLMLLYFAICESCWGKTLGKKLMGLQVVQAMPQKQKEEIK